MTLTAPASCSSSGDSCSANVDCCQDGGVLVCNTGGSCSVCYRVNALGCVRDDQCCGDLVCGDSGGRNKCGSKPDLRVSVVSAPSSLVAGSTSFESVRISLKNVGSSVFLSGSDRFKVRLLLKAARGSEYTLNTVSYSSSYLGTEQNMLVGSLPDSASAGSYNFKVVIDVDDDVDESDDGNNDAFRFLTLTAPASCSSSGGSCATASCCVNLVCRSNTCVSACEYAGGQCYSVRCSADSCLLSTTSTANAYCNAKNANYECCIFDELCDE